MKHMLPIAAAIFALGFAGTSQAVDVVNEDQTTHQVVITQGEDAEAFDLEGGQSLADICDKCLLQVGDSEPVSTEGDQVAVIKGGKIEIKSRTN